MITSIDENLINAIGQALTRNEYVRRDLPDGSRLHIDRQLPFLCVYRRPIKRKDPGTERLLLGEASYLLATSRERHYSEIVKLVEEIAKRQGKTYGAFLLFELWSTDLQANDMLPLFRIHAQRHGAPQHVLEELESELLSISVEGHESQVELTYEESIHPPELKPLLPDTLPNCITLGLEVNPIYRDADSNELFPFTLRNLHHELARVLKRTFYAFTHSHTTNKPAHYHELGRHTMTKVVNETDSRLAKISQQFDLLLHVTPVNVEHAREKFSQSKHDRIPVFLYRPRPIDPALVKRELYSIPIEQIEDPTLASIFEDKQNELDRQVTLIAERNTPRFLAGSQMLFGDIEPELKSLAEEILSKIPAHTPDDRSSDYLDVEEFAEIAYDEVEFYRNQNPNFSTRVELRDDVTGVFVSKGNFLIGRDAYIPRRRVEATLAHEIGTHALTYFNGKQQPLREFFTGMADYESMQEGLAVLAEYLVGGLSRPRLRTLAGRVIAVQSIYQGADFIETFRILHDQFGFNQSIAFNITMRIYRGGGYTKDIVYLRGLMNLLTFLANGGDLEMLFLGKISFDRLAFVDELQWRKVLVPAALRPRYLDRSDVKNRLSKIRKGISVLELITENS